MLGLVFSLMTFIACGGDDEEDNGGNGQTAGSSAATEDYGTDGMKGYWIQNTWDEIKLEAWTYYSYTGYKNADTYGQESNLIYLDGDGGGTIYFSVTTPDHAANNAKYLAGKVGTFLDTADGTTKEYHFRKSYWHYRGSGVYVSDTDTEYAAEASSPIEYYIKGTTMTIYYADLTESKQLNVSSGNVSGYHRLKKVD